MFTKCTGLTYHLHKGRQEAQYWACNGRHSLISFTFLCCIQIKLWRLTQTSCKIKYMYTCSMKPTEKCSSTFHSSDEGTHTMYSQGPVSKAITVNPERLASIIFSVFLTGPLLTSIKFNVFENINTRQYTYMYMQSKPWITHTSTKNLRVHVAYLLALTITTNCFSLYLSFTVIVIVLRLSFSDQRLVASSFVSQENSDIFS